MLHPRKQGSKYYEVKFVASRINTDSGTILCSLSLSSLHQNLCVYVEIVYSYKQYCRISYYYLKHEII